MAYFRVRLDRTVFEHAMVYVEAETKARAKELAIEEALTGESFEWKWKDTLDEADVFDIEQISEAEWRGVDGCTHLDMVFRIENGAAVGIDDSEGDGDEGGR